MLAKYRNTLQFAIWCYSLPNIGNEIRIFILLTKQWVYYTMFTYAKAAMRQKSRKNAKNTTVMII